MHDTYSNALSFFSDYELLLLEVPLSTEELMEEQQKQAPEKWYSSIFAKYGEEEVKNGVEFGSKVVMLLEILKLAKQHDDKVLVVM